MEELTRSILETSQFQAENEIHHLISSAHDSSAASFTALLELPPSQAAHLLHFDNAGGLVFPAEGGLIDRDAKFSVFSSGAVGGSKSSSRETTSDSVAVKCEPPETTDSLNNQSGPLVSDPPAQYVAHLNQRSAKRKEREKKVNDNDNNNNKGAKKKSKSGGAKESSEEAEKLPYVHVRARRGQATDSHSLAERARREKINARMKLLQELVPGCNKISGTALVLDEIINHVQSLQRQVEFLSMRLAAVNPRIDFNLDSLFTTENGSLVESNLSSMIMPMMLPEVQSNGNRQHYQPQWPFDPLHQPVCIREEECPNFITLENSLLSYDSGNSVSLHSNLVKMEL